MGQRWGTVSQEDGGSRSAGTAVEKHNQHSPTPAQSTPGETGASFLPRGSPHTSSIASIPQQPPTRCQPCPQHAGTLPGLTTKVKLLGEVAR